MIATLKRREFITLLGGAAAAWPHVARAQQAERIRRIGVLMGQAESDPENPARVAAFRQALGKLGWSEGQNVAIDFRWGAGDPDQMRAQAKELIGATPDLVVAESRPATTALRQVAPALPIVFLQVANPVESGFVASLPRPGGNLTGFTNFEPTMGGKWLELLKEIAPRVTRVLAIYNPETHSGQYWQALEAAARSSAVELERAAVRDAAGIERAVAVLMREPGGGVLVLPDSFNLAHRDLIVALTLRYDVPSISAFPDFARRGSLLGYGGDLIEIYRRVATYVDRILKGERPGDLPVEAPTKFQMIVNLKTAKALGLTVPLTLQAVADEVIE